MLDAWLCLSNWKIGWGMPEKIRRFLGAWEIHFQAMVTTVSKREFSTGLISYSKSPSQELSEDQDLVKIELLVQTPRSIKLFRQFSGMPNFQAPVFRLKVRRLKIAWLFQSCLRQDSPEKLTQAYLRQPPNMSTSNLQQLFKQLAELIKVALSSWII